jgi:hypothetical protein
MSQDGEVVPFPKVRPRLRVIKPSEACSIVPFPVWASRRRAEQLYEAWLAAALVRVRARWAGYHDELSPSSGEE